jgi:hypothetical protein
VQERFSVYRQQVQVQLAALDALLLLRLGGILVVVSAVEVTVALIPSSLQLVAII